MFGATIPVNVRTAVRCEDCSGSGAAEGTKPVTCSECNGRGQVQRMRQSLLGQMVTTSACPRCNGAGQVIASPCTTCGGEGRTITEKEYQVDIPAGVDTGSTLRLTGRGAVGPRGGGAGDLYVHLRVAPHERFRRENDDLVTDLPGVDRAGGARHQVRPRRRSTARRRSSSRPERSPVASSCSASVASLVCRVAVAATCASIVDVQVPTKLTDAEADLLRKFAEGRGEAVTPPEKGLFSRIKSSLP